MTLTIRLREHRERAELSQAELADRAKTTQRTVSVLETNKGRRIDLGVLERLAAVLGVPALSLLAEVPTPKRKGRTRRSRTA